jgi:hypothetical protein
MILGMTPMSAWRLSVLGLRMPEDGRGIRARVGVVPLADNLDPDVRVDENLEVHASDFGIDRPTILERIPRLLEFANLTDRRHARTDTLPVEGLPELMQAAIQALPLTHAVALTRPLVAGMPVCDVLLHLAVLAAYGLVGLYIALILARRRLLV